MESWLLGTHVQCGMVERIQASEPGTGSFMSPLCHSLFPCLSSAQSLSPCLSFPSVKCRTIVQTGGNVSKNYLVQCLAHSKSLIKIAIISWLVKFLTFLKFIYTFRQLPACSPVGRAGFREVKEPSDFPLRLHWLFYTLSWYISSSFPFFLKLEGGNSTWFSRPAVWFQRPS